MWERDAGVCGFCGESAEFETFHLDHVVPKRDGGTDKDHNRRVAHPYCNQAAGARLAHLSRVVTSHVEIHVRLELPVYELVRAIALVDECTFNTALNRVLRRGLRIMQADREQAN